MGRNDPCFCGSGKKLKKCHPDIHEESFAAETYRLYAEIDRCIQEHYKDKNIDIPCFKGCYACCYDAFLISDIEFSIIAYEMRKWEKEKIDNIAEKAKKYWEEFRKTEPEISRTFEEVMETADINYIDAANVLELKRLPYPCVFLDENNKCSIYNFRPVVCRLQGTAYIQDDNGEVCENIGNINSAKKWQANISHLIPKINELSIINDTTKNIDIVLRQTLFLYAVYRYFVKYDGLNIPDEEYKFQMSKQQYINRITKRGVYV